jgi:hypothetical protein
MLHAVVCNFCGIDSSNYKIQRLGSVGNYQLSVILFTDREVVAMRV